MAAGHFIYNNSTLDELLTKITPETETKQKVHLNLWGCSSVGRAPALQAGGHEFESHHLHSIVSKGNDHCREICSRYLENRIQTSKHRLKSYEESEKRKHNESEENPSNDRGTRKCSTSQKRHKNRRSIEFAYNAMYVKENSKPELQNWFCE